MAVPTTTLWEREPHTAAKHALLDRYLAAWYPIMAKSFNDNGITFADGFAGPGEYLNSTESSPVIALRHALRNEVTIHRTPSRVLLLEADQQRAAHLENVLERRYSERPPELRVLIKNAPCEQALLPELAVIGAWNGPIFANLDGWGVDTPYEIVRRVALQPSSEVLITFQDSWFTRFATLEHLSSGDTVFGDRSWRQVVDQPSHRKKAFLVDRYRARVMDAGFRLTLTFEMLDESGHALFLVYGTSSEKGLEKMKDALWLVDPLSGGRFRDPRDPDQLSFGIDAPDFTPLKSLILRTLEESEESLAGLSRLALLESIYKPTHVKPVVDGLVNAGQVRQVRGGLRNEDRVFTLDQRLF